MMVTIGFLVLAVIELFNGLGLAFRTRRTLETAGLVHADGRGLLIQEFGVYGIGLAGAYLVAAYSPARLGRVGVAGLAINIGAATMHFRRSVGVYVGDARPVLSRAFERNAGLVHAFALVLLFLGLRGAALGA